MTLLVAIRGMDGLVLAADSRGTFGDPSGTTAQNDSQQKAHILSNHAAALVAGAGEVGALVIQEATSRIAASAMDGVTAVLNELRNTVRELYGQWFPSVPAIPPPQAAMMGQVPTRPGLSFLVAGYEIVEGQPAEPKIYQLQSFTDFSPMLHDYGFAVAGVAQYALYLLNRLYESDRTIEELTALAVYVVTETASQDGKVGGPVKVITIRPEKGGVALDEKSVENVLAHNEARSSALRDSFYGRGGS